MMTKIFTICLLSALLLIAGHYFIQEDGYMLFANSRSAAEDMIPPLDEKVPAKTETATFALG